MVKFRGIDLSIVSQFDIRKLPEFSVPPHLLQQLRPTSPTKSLSPDRTYPCEDDDPFTTSKPSKPPSTSAGKPLVAPRLRNTLSAMAPCFVAVYAGSHIWLEYSVSPPQPPNAAYFFKLLHNGQAITSWDCTAKCGYAGKMSYALEVLSAHQLDVRRRAMRFGSERTSAEEAKLGMKVEDDCLEVRVCRIEKRKRIRIDEDPILLADKVFVPRAGAALHLINGGFVEPGRPTRRYRYQLLDAVDLPYAAFRFYYRSYDFLEDNNIISPLSSHTTSSRISSPNWLASSVWSPGEEGLIGTERADVDAKRAADKDDAIAEAEAETPTDSGYKDNECADRTVKAEIRSLLGATDSEQSLLLRAKDSIEDLHSTVPRSPRTSDKAGRSPGKEWNEIPPSPTRPVDDSPTKLLRSPTRLRKKQKQKEQLIVSLAGAEFSIDKCRRPVSPFSEGGFLRKLVSGGRSPNVEGPQEAGRLGDEPLSAPAGTTGFSLDVWDEVEEVDRAQREWAEAKQRVTGRQAEAKGSKIKLSGCESTTREKRGGKSLMGLLGRRVARESSGDSST